jgi:hypothetical protein
MEPVHRARPVVADNARMGSGAGHRHLECATEGILQGNGAPFLLPGFHRPAHASHSATRNLQRSPCPCFMGSPRLLRPASRTAFCREAAYWGSRSCQVGFFYSQSILSAWTVRGPLQVNAGNDLDVVGGQVADEPVGHCADLVDDVALLVLDQVPLTAGATQKPRSIVAMGRKAWARRSVEGSAFSMAMATPLSSFLISMSSTAMAPVPTTSPRSL